MKKCKVVFCLLFIFVFVTAFSSDLSPRDVQKKVQKRVPPRQTVRWEQQYFETGQPPAAIPGDQEQEEDVYVFPNTQPLAAAQWAASYGIITRYNASIHVLNAENNTISGQLFDGQLGTSDGVLLDVVISSDGETAAVSNFGDQKIYLLKITDPPAVWKKGQIQMPFFAEDLAITPDGRHILCTDGLFADSIGVVDVHAKELINHFQLSWGRDAQAVEIGADGKTVMTSDYWGGLIQVLRFHPDTGDLTYAGKFDLIEGQDLPDDMIVPWGFEKTDYDPWPINVGISPDGKTALVVDSFSDQLLVFRIDWVGKAVPTALVHAYPFWKVRDGVIEIHSQSVVFSPDGRNAYSILTIIENGEQRSEIAVYNVLGPGDVVFGYTLIPVKPYRGLGGFFGVDTLAIEPGGRYLYVGNPTPAGGKHKIVVIDLWSHTPAGTILVTSGQDLPISIAFRRY